MEKNATETSPCLHVSLSGSKGVRGELNPPPRLSQSRMLADYNTDTSGQRKGRELNPQGVFQLGRFPTGPRRQSGCPSVAVETVRIELTQAACKAASRPSVHASPTFQRGTRNWDRGTGFRSAFHVPSSAFEVPRPGFEPGTPRSKRGMMVRFTIGAAAEGEGVEPSSPGGDPP